MLSDARCLIGNFLSKQNPLRKEGVFALETYMFPKTKTGRSEGPERDGARDREAGPACAP